MSSEESGDSFDLGRTLRALEEDLQLTQGFFRSLASENDWSFVIKSHALVETALSHLLAVAVRDPRTVEIFARMETSNGRTGKLAFLKTMQLLDDHSVRFIRSLSELRNDLVHDVKQTSFSFDAHLAGLTKQRRQAFRQAFGWAIKPHPDAPRDDWKEQVFDRPKPAILINLLVLLADAYLSKVKFQPPASLDEDEFWDETT